jgi:hypothetical protein
MSVYILPIELAAIGARVRVYTRLDGCRAYAFASLHTEQLFVLHNQ